MDDGASAPRASLVALVEDLAAMAARVAQYPVAGLVEPDASTVHAALRRVQDQVGIAAARVLARVEADGRWATTRAGRGARDFEDWVAAETNGSRAGARRQARLARAVDEGSVPGLADAVVGGGVSLEHAEVLTRLGPTTQARREALRSGGTGRDAAHLLEQATGLGVDEFTKEVKRWAALVDPSADERGHREATGRVSCTLGPQDGGVGMTAFMTAVDGACFEQALSAVAGVPAADDVRTHAQRMGAALGDMARLVLDHGLAAGSSGGFRPHVSVHVSLETLIAQVQAVSSTEAAEHGARGAAAFPAIPPGWEAAVLADGTPIPACVLARLACDSEVSRVVFGPDSQVLDVGRAERLYTGALRRAVIARDRHCAYPGCDRPPRFGEIHHVRHWAAGGATSLENGILLCWFHHDVVHSRYLRIHRDHARGRWDFAEADGTPIPHPGARPPDRGPDWQPDRGPDPGPACGADPGAGGDAATGGDHDDGTLFAVA